MSISSVRTRLFASGSVRLALSLIFISSLAFGLAVWRAEIVAAFQIEAPVDDEARPEAVVAVTNPAAITIPAIGNASPYPSAITVSGLSGNIANTAGSVKVTLNSFSHTFPDDVGMVLVGPSGAALLLQNSVTSSSGGQAATNVTYTISDDGLSALPDGSALSAGTFRPASYREGNSFPAPGPLTTYGNPGPIGGGTATFSTTFGGLLPNGVWNLYVVDFGAGMLGVSAAGGH